MRGGRGRGREQPNSVPPSFMNYVCRRCNKTGHFIQFCPTNNDPSFDVNGKNAGRTDLAPMPPDRVICRFKLEIYLFPFLNVSFHS
jgi:hypothetical protein